MKMDWHVIGGSWHRFRDDLKAEWSALTDEHIDRIGGQRDQLSEKLQEFYGISKDAADAQIDAFANRIGDRNTG